MLSPDYKERFIAEYCQVSIRLGKLKEMLQKWSVGRLEFEPTCPKELLELQLKAMEEYQKVLKIRALIEKIKLPKMEE